MKSNYIAKVPNTETGKMFIKMLRDAMNSETYCLRLRGSSLDFNQMKADGYTWEQYRARQDCGSLPLKYSREIRIYLHAKVKRPDGGWDYPLVQPTEHQPFSLRTQCIQLQAQVDRQERCLGDITGRINDYRRGL